MEPLKISRSVTITENILSEDANTPPIFIDAPVEVRIENCDLVGKASLIKNVPGAKVIIRNTKGRLTTDIKDIKATHGFSFANLNNPALVIIENNEFENCGGISINKASGPIRIRFNKARNMVTRHLAQLNSVRNNPFIEIAWNEYIGEPNKSAVEDIINFYNSGGTRLNPARIHNNFLKGSYPYLASGSSASGSGIIMDGDAGPKGITPDYVPHWVEAYDNQIVATSNAGMNIATGNNIHYYRNRIVNSGMFPDGGKYNYGYAGVSIWKRFAAHGDDVFFNNRMTDNVIGYVNWKDKFEAGGKTWMDRRDISYNDYSKFITGTIHFDHNPTIEDEEKEYQIWQEKLKANDIIIGIKPKSYSFSELLTLAQVQASTAEEVIQKVEQRGREKRDKELRVFLGL